MDCWKAFVNEWWLKKIGNMIFHCKVSPCKTAAAAAAANLPRGEEIHHLSPWCVLSYFALKPSVSIVRL